MNFFNFFHIAMITFVVSGDCDELGGLLRGDFNILINISMGISYINPLFAVKHTNQLGIRLESLKVIFIIDFRAVTIEMNFWSLKVLAKLFCRLFLKFTQVTSDDSFFDLPRDVLYLWRIKSLN